MVLHSSFCIVACWHVAPHSPLGCCHLLLHCCFYSNADWRSPSQAPPPPAPSKFLHRMWLPAFLLCSLSPRAYTAAACLLPKDAELARAAAPTPKLTTEPSWRDTLTTLSSFSRTRRRAAHQYIKKKKRGVLDVYVSFVVSPLYKGFCAYFLIHVHVYIEA